MTPETKLKQQVKDYLKLKGIDWFYNLQALGAYKGIPDISILKDGKTFYVEFKSEKGKLSEYQEKFKAMCQRNKNPYWIIRSVYDFKKLMKLAERIKAK